MYDWTASFRFTPKGQTGAAIYPHKATIRAYTLAAARESFREQYPSAILIRIVPATKSIRYPSA